MSKSIVPLLLPVVIIAPPNFIWMVQSEFGSLTLFPATPAQLIESRKRSWREWGGMLTEEQYVDRDAQMDTMEHAIDSRLITWVLAPRNDPETLDFMCSCETFKRKGFVRYVGSNEVKEVTCYAVASVFTPPHKRGKGYASHMMRLLHWVTSGRSTEFNLPSFPEQWGSPPPEVKEAGNGVFSALYSDVGDSFYKQVGPGTEKEGGWEVMGAFSTTWEIPAQTEVQQHGTHASNEWTWLKDEDLDALWAKDVQIIRRTMESFPESSPDYHTVHPTAFVSYLPDKGVAAFHISRSMFGSDSIVSMDIWGIEKKNGCIDQPTYASWSVDVRPLPPTLIVTRLCATESEFPELLGKIQEAARKSGIGKMEIWNIPKHLLKVAEGTGGRNFERTEHLPALKWYGNGKTTHIEWVFNEKFAWC